MCSTSIEMPMSDGTVGVVSVGTMVDAVAGRGGGGGRNPDATGGAGGSSGASY